MEEFYPQVRAVHIAAVAASGSLFLLRGLFLNVLGASWPRALAVRWLSYAIDTTLLTAAFILMTIVKQYPFVHGWLTVKVLLLIVYVSLGVLAFRPEGAKRRRIGYWLAALVVFGVIISVARAHNPLGFLAGVG